MNCRENKAACRVIFFFPDRGLKALHSEKQRLHRILSGGEEFQKIQLPASKAHALQIRAVPKRSLDQLHRRQGRPVKDSISVSLQLTDCLSDIFRRPGILPQGRKQRHSPRKPADLLRHLLRDVQAQLIINLKKKLRIRWILQETVNCSNVIYHTACEKGQVRAPHIIGNSFPLKAIHQRNRAFVVAVQNRRGFRPSAFFCTLFCRLYQIAVLILSLLYRENTNLGVLLSGRKHRLPMTQPVMSDQLTGCLHDGRIRAKILLHEKHLCARMILFKGKERLRICRTESVDALILIADHEQVSISRKELQDPVLDFRRILCLIHTQIPVSGLVLGKKLRAAHQNIQRIDHLIVVIHPPLPLHFFAVALIDFCKRIAGFLLQLLQLLSGKLHILDIADPAPKLRRLRLRGKASRSVNVKIPEKLQNLTLVRLQRKRLLPDSASIICDHTGADPVDGPELKSARRIGKLRAEHPFKPPSHVLRRRHGIGYGQDLLRQNAKAEEHISKPCHQNGCLSGSRNSKNKDRTVHCLNGPVLLICQLQRIFLFIFFKRHEIHPRRILGSFLINTCLPDLRYPLPHSPLPWSCVSSHSASQDTIPH